MRCACIDIGSNTTRLLVAEPDGRGGLRQVGGGSALNRLGAQRGPDGALHPERLRQAAADLRALARVAEDHGAVRILAVATAAVRGAPDVEAVVTGLEVPDGVALHVLPGEHEAQLAFSGATCALEPVPDGPVAVVDVGGGSTELVVGTCAGAGPTWSVSLPMGSGTLAEAFLHGDPPTAVELDALRAHVGRVFADLDPPPVDAAWAVGGSAMSIARVLGGGDLSRPALARALDALCAADRVTLARRHGLDPERARLLPAGLVLLDAAARSLGVGLAGARGGLREGVILAMLEGRL